MTTLCHPEEGQCSCHRGLGGTPLTDCLHLRSLKTWIREHGYECPFCAGLGERSLSRVELADLMQSGKAESYRPEMCNWCRGKGRTRERKTYETLLLQRQKRKQHNG